jgi:hypothetical protein
MISGIGKVVLPVGDQERAKQLWTLFEDPDGTRYALGQWE